MKQSVRVCYVGGGSLFVVTLVHGLLAYADDLRSAGVSVDLQLVDIDPAACELNKAYAEMAGKHAGLPIRVEISADRRGSMDGSDIVFCSVGASSQIKERRRDLLAPFGEIHGETAPAVATEVATQWSFYTSLARDIRDLSPSAWLCTLVNPTDVVAGSLSRRFGIEAFGLCVEVGNLRGWLAHYCDTPVERVGIHHIGANHLGWVTSIDLDGRDGFEVLGAAFPKLPNRPDWNPAFDWLLEVHRRTGCLRQSPWHAWPYTNGLDEPERRARFNAFLSRYKIDRAQRRQQCRSAVEAAVAGHTPISVGPEPCASFGYNLYYPYPITRFALGALVAGRAGCSTDIVPLQFRNGDAYPYLPARAWVEAPARILSDGPEPIAVRRPNDTVFSFTAMQVARWTALADWFSGEDACGLDRALLTDPTDGSLEAAARLSDRLRRTVDSV